MEEKNVQILQGNVAQYLIEKRELNNYQSGKCSLRKKPSKWTSVVSGFNKSGEACTGGMRTSKNDKLSVYHSENWKKV